MKVEWERLWKKHSYSVLRYYARIFLKGLSNTAKASITIVGLMFKIWSRKFPNRKQTSGPFNCISVCSRRNGDFCGYSFSHCWRSLSGLKCFCWQNLFLCFHVCLSLSFCPAMTRIYSRYFHLCLPLYFDGMHSCIIFGRLSRSWLSWFCFVFGNVYFICDSVLFFYCFVQNISSLMILHDVPRIGYKLLTVCFYVCVNKYNFISCFLWGWHLISHS
jgi:hypothetical protein